MFSRIFGVIMAIGFASSIAQAEIISCKTMKDVQAKIEEVLEKNSPEDVWVPFDVDMTLIQPVHPAAYYPNVKKYRDIYKSILDTLSPVQIDVMHSLVVLTMPQKWVEEDTPRIVEDLQARGVRTMAFTATVTGKLKGYAKKAIFIRRDQLQKVGLDFSSKLTQFPLCVSFMDFPRYAGSYPTFYHGVLSSNGERKVSKGQTFVAFLKHMGPKHQVKVGMGHYPKVIIFPDDRMKNLEDVEKHLKEYDSSIQFIGIEYQGAFSYAPEDISKEDFQKFWQSFAEKAKAQVQ
jgi:hypothetical protein